MALAARHRVHLVIGLGLRDPLRVGVMHNASLLIGPDGVLGSYTKVHQWQNEKLFFTGGDRIETFPVFGTRLGMQICYDIRFPEITRILALQGASIVTSVWASFGAENARSAMRRSSFTVPIRGRRRTASSSSAATAAAAAAGSASSAAPARWGRMARCSARSTMTARTCCA